MTHESSSRTGLTLRAINLLKTRIPVTVLVAVAALALLPYLLKYLNRNKPVLEIPSSNKPLGIEELIANLKTELGHMEDERYRKNEAASFDILGFDLEISFVVRASSTQKTGFEYQVVTADTEIQQGIEKVQRLTVHMKPIGNQKIPTNLIDFPQNDFGESIDKPPPKKETKR